MLRTLPSWFGIEDAIRGYVRAASELDSFLAVRDGITIGIALIERHFPESAELSLIAVDAVHRASGIGGRLMDAVESALRTDGVRFLEVHTVGPSYDDAGYAATRAFYRGLGFTPIHEYDRLDWDGPTLVLIKQLTAS